MEKKNRLGKAGEKTNKTPASTKRNNIASDGDGMEYGERSVWEWEGGYA